MKLSCSMTKAHRIITDKLGLKYYYAYWVPHFLSDEQKISRKEFCQKFLKKYGCMEKKCTYNIVTGDETWVFSYDPLPHKSAGKYLKKGQGPPMVVQKSLHPLKIQIAVFFSRAGILTCKPLIEQPT